MTNERAVQLLSQMFLIQFNEEEHEALAMAIEALEEKYPCGLCKYYEDKEDWGLCQYCPAEPKGSDGE